MAFLSSLVVQVAKNNSQSLSQSFMLDKKSVSAISNLIRVNTKRHWKPLMVIGAAGALAYGAFKVRTEILQQREDTKLVPTDLEARNLAHTAHSVDSNCGPDRGGYAEIDSLADEFLEEIEEQLELEDCLENDPTASADVRWSSAERELEIVDLQISSRTAGEDCNDAVIQELKLKKCIISEEAYHKEQYRKQRKRVRIGQLSNAVRGLASKIRASFPIPDGSTLQQKAMCLYAAKECRKMSLRETQIAVMVPKAVALASIPTTSQVDLRRIVNIESVELKYKKMAWSGFKNKQGWAAHLASLFA
jgi:hypothetical protein